MRRKGTVPPHGLAVEGTRLVNTNGRLGVQFPNGTVVEIPGACVRQWRVESQSIDVTSYGDASRVYAPGPTMYTVEVEAPELVVRDGSGLSVAYTQGEAEQLAKRKMEPEPAVPDGKVVRSRPRRSIRDRRGAA